MILEGNSPPSHLLPNRTSIQMAEGSSWVLVLGWATFRYHILFYQYRKGKYALTCGVDSQEDDQIWMGEILLIWGHRQRCMRWNSGEYSVSLYQSCFPSKRLVTWSNSFQISQPASPRSLLEMQNLGFTLDLFNQNLRIKKTPMKSVHTLKFVNSCCWVILKNTAM